MQRFIQQRTPRVVRHRRVRARIMGTAERPRISVFRSAKHLVAQVIDDRLGKTMAAASDAELEDGSWKMEAGIGRKVSAARALGKLLAERARAKGVTSVVFDRGGYAYHGRVQAVADGAREGGLVL